MARPSYSELLRDPRWQRKRLEVMQASDFACQNCGDDRTTLNVHHLHYVSGRKPWEYGLAELRCLCEPCHKLEHDVDAFIAAEEQARVRMAVLRHERPEEWALIREIEVIDEIMPTAAPDRRDVLIRRKMELRDKLRGMTGRRWTES